MAAAGATVGPALDMFMLNGMISLPSCHDGQDWELCCACTSKTGKGAWDTGNHMNHNHTRRVQAWKAFSPVLRVKYAVEAVHCRTGVGGPLCERKFMPTLEALCQSTNTISDIWRGALQERKIADFVQDATPNPPPQASSATWAHTCWNRPAATPAAPVATPRTFAQIHAAAQPKAGPPPVPPPGILPPIVLDAKVVSQLPRRVEELEAAVEEFSGQVKDQVQELSRRVHDQVSELSSRVNDLEESLESVNSRVQALEQVPLAVAVPTSPVVDGIILKAI